MVGIEYNKYYILSFFKKYDIILKLKEGLYARIN